MLGSIMYDIYLFGPFDIRHRKFGAKKPKSLKQCALIALLALAPHKRRSRAWLKAMLWCEKDEEAASSNLRQALRQLRKHFGTDVVIDGDRFDVWLVEDLCQIEPPHDSDVCLLEGLDINEEVFEDWLREQRTKFEYSDLKVATATSRNNDRREFVVAEDKARVPRVLLQKDIPEFISAEFLSLTEFVSTGLATSLHEWSSAEIFDPSASNSGSPDCDAMIDYVLVLRATKALGAMHLTYVLYRAHDGTLCETMLLQLSDDGIMTERSYKETARFIERASLTFASRVSQDARAGLISNPTVFSVHDLFSPDRSRQLEGLNRLAALKNVSGVARAWMVYGQVVCIAECSGHDTTLEEVQENCALALETAPYHPIVNALIGHINAFFFRDFSRAEELLSMAKSQSPHNSIVLSHYAAAENYFGSPERGLKLAQNAIRLNPNSFIRYIFDCDLQMSMTLRGRHAEAAVLGERVLRTSPNFLGAKRYLMASYVQLGAYDKARQRIAEIQSLDANFSSEGVSKSNYPLPSERSVSLIADSLQAMGH